MVVIKVNAINKLKVKVVMINGGNMYLGTNGFTQAMVNKLLLGN